MTQRNARLRRSFRFRIPDVIWISVGMALLSALSAQMIQSKMRTVSARK